MYENLRTFQHPRLSVTFYSEDIRHYVSKSSKDQKCNIKVAWPPFFSGGGRPQLFYFYSLLLARFTVHRLAKFGWVPFAGVRLRILAMK